METISHSVAIDIIALNIIAKIISATHFFTAEIMVSEAISSLERKLSGSQFGFISPLTKFSECSQFYVIEILDRLHTVLENNNVSVFASPLVNTVTAPTHKNGKFTKQWQI